MYYFKSSSLLCGSALVNMTSTYPPLKQAFFCSVHTVTIVTSIVSLHITWAQDVFFCFSLLFDEPSLFMLMALIHEPFLLSVDKR